MKLTIALRVIGGFTIITLLLLIISLSSVFNTNSIGASSDSVNRMAVPALDAVGNLKVELLELSNISLAVYHETSLTELDALRKNFNESAKSAQENENALEQLLAGQGLDRQLKSSEQALTTYQEQILSIFEHQRTYLNLRDSTRAQLEEVEFSLGDASFMMLDIMDASTNADVNTAAEALDRSLNNLITLLYDLRNADALDRAQVIRSEVNIVLEGLDDRLNTLTSNATDATNDMVTNAVSLINSARDQLEGQGSFTADVIRRLETRRDTTTLIAEANTTQASALASTNELQTRVRQVADAAQEEVQSTISTTGWVNGILALVSIALAIAISWLTVRSISRPLAQVNHMLNVMAEGNLTQRVDYDAQDEFGELAANTNKLTDNLRELINGIASRSTQLAAAAEESSTVSEQTTNAIEDQRGQIEQVATATQEMNSTSSEMANGASEALQEIQHSDEEATRVRQISAKNKATIEALASEIKGASDVINKLYQNSTNIGSILDVIRGIADQTNLLALNAAIEAARAGEQGRGFAVVADEVRTLASRTQESTEEIHTMIESLQSDAQRAVTVMNKGREQAEVCVGQSDEAAEALQSITDSVHQASDSSNHIATAALEQSKTAQDISERLEQIVSIAEQTAEGSKQTASASNEVAKLSQELQDSIKSFTV